MITITAEEVFSDWRFAKQKLVAPIPSEMYEEIIAMCSVYVNKILSESELKEYAKFIWDLPYDQCYYEKDGAHKAPLGKNLIVKAVKELEIPSHNQTGKHNIINRVHINKYVKDILITYLCCKEKPEMPNELK